MHNIMEHNTNWLEPNIPEVEGRMITEVLSLSVNLSHLKTEACKILEEQNQHKEWFLSKTEM